jgi:hypothetical protein
MISDTSIKSYKEIIAEGLLGRMEERVFHLILTYPSNSDRTYAQIGHLRINQVTARRNELVAQGCVEDAGYQQDEETGRTVHVWAVPKVIYYRSRPKQPKTAQKRLTEFKEVRA